MKRHEVPAVPDGYVPPSTSFNPDVAGAAATETIEGLRAEVARLRAGEDATPPEPGVERTPGQWIHNWNSLTAEQRLLKVKVLYEMMDVGWRCLRMNHDAEAAEYHDLCSYVSRLHSGEEIASLHLRISRVEDLAREWVRRAEFNPEPGMAEEVAADFGRAVLAALDRRQPYDGDRQGDAQ